ncbi:PQQ-dependent sugar dehydrogenase [Candidatus Poriferisodalis sp.]|uniref:PQQ-dependent sugar dehydrogenase n=1 Tax=Candidatus Poriferisodalis sp. TaxID=3101277 RepID=UPI003B012390
MPIALVAKPDTGQRYVASLTGQIWLLDPLDGNPAGNAAATGSDPDDGHAAASAAPLLVGDIGSLVSQGCENGLLGIAFSPDGSDLYLSYTDAARNSRIAAVPMAGEFPRMDRRRVLLALDQPACNHNGGHLAFGPDGNLWIGFGDGGGADDVFGHGQDRSSLLATIVRIDPNHASGQGYGIPDGNPFAGSGHGAPPVWAYGLRNPWRFAFDRRTGDLWIGDVGQNRTEEIHVLSAAAGWSPGANLGWPLFEGNERFSGDVDGEALPADLAFPVHTYGHDEGCSVTGGYVYRGSAMAGLEGTYVFGDYCTGELWGLLRGPDGEAVPISLGASVPRNTLVSFGEDADGEIYALSAAGTVFRLAPAAR